MSDVTLPARLRAGLLILPLALFLAVFFLWPLWTMIAVAVRDDAMAGALPETAAVIGGWDGEAPPSMDIQQAFMKDLREVDNATLGPAVRRLNSAVSGFRTLMGKTQRVARDMADGEPVDMPSIDDRWSDPAFPRAFPWFAEARHWEDVLVQMQEQLAAMREPMFE